uniref:Homing endonuclease LAGLIDADG domain-containing protein n=1 Tax=Orbilia brochopaga TaxID=3140254 RepID=A0A481ZN60_9PEZI|nr:hypothetical protein [Drechslerella brochopaga]QBL02517.1 hypothetical protein [Drechslerella brochopaga]
MKNLVPIKQLILSISDTLLTSVCYYALPIIGIPSSKSRSNRSKWLSEAEYLTVPKSFLAFLVGFIDGDGCISIKRDKDYVTFRLIISLHLDDISTINYIQSVLKIGKIYTYPSRKSPTVKLVFNKTELQEVLFPLLQYHGIFFLTKNRRTQYDLAMFILNNNVKLSSELIQTVPVIHKQPKTAKGYVNLPFFNDWIVGFTCGEGSFFIKQNNDGCFQLKQKLHFLLFDAFKLVFNTTRKITVDKELYAQFGVSSKSDVQNVINFFSFSGHHALIGLKFIQYSIWLEKLKNSSRYAKLNFPR